MVVTLVCAAIIVPAAAGALLLLPSSAFAQQEETSLGEEGDDFASGIVSGVLDGSSDDEDDNNDNEENEGGGVATSGDDDGTNTQIAVPITDQDQHQDQRAADLALNEALDVTVEETPEPTPGGGLPQECSLEITADKEIYEPGDAVIITVTNTGDEPLDFPDAALGLQIKNVDTGEVFPIDAAQVVTTLEPGQTRIFGLTYERLVDEIGTGLISATVTSDCGFKEVTFTLSEPGFVAFCNEFSSVEVHCYQSQEDCIVGEGLFNVQDPHCEGVVTFPTGDLVGRCRVDRSPQGTLFAACSFI